MANETTKQTGPFYGVELIKSLPMGNGMTQAMPSRRDLEEVAGFNKRMVGGYEVAIATLAATTAKLEQAEAELEALREKLPVTADGVRVTEAVEAWFIDGDRVVQGAVGIEEQAMYPAPELGAMAQPTGGISVAYSTRAAADAALARTTEGVE